MMHSLCKTALLSLFLTLLACSSYDKKVSRYEATCKTHGLEEGSYAFARCVANKDIFGTVSISKELGKHAFQHQNNCKTYQLGGKTVKECL